MLTLTQRDGKWVVLRDGNVLAVKDNHDDAIAAMLAIEEETPSAAALLAETWEGPIARSKLTGDGRDFTACKWTWRDPAESRLPLMWQTETDMGHFSALLAGYMTSLRVDDSGTVWATGKFFDNDQGREFRDVLASAGRWGVSVDPGAVEWEDTCLEEDDEGWCVEGLTTFLAYEIIGVTGTPFPAFEDAWIELSSTSSQPTETDAEAARLAIDNMPEHAFDDSDDDGKCNFETEGGQVCDGTEDEHVGRWSDSEDSDEDDSEEMRAISAAGGPAKPPAAWFENPNLSEPTPIQITDQGQVFGHVATFDQCHIGWNDTCITAPDRVATRMFHTGTVLTREGTTIPTGPLIMGTDHPATDPSITAQAAIDHYSHTGLAWADVRLGVDDIGIWCAGALRPGISDDQVRVLRGSSLSGDWRTIDGELQLCAVLAVNTPGFPIPRALAASGRPYPREAKQLRARLVAGRPVAATGLGIVKCTECAKRAQAAHGSSGPDARIDTVLQLLHVIETRTRALAQTRREQLRARLRRE